MKRKMFKLGKMLRLIRSIHTNASRPELLSILPSKSTINRLLFDQDSRLPYKKALPVYQAVYDSLLDDSVKLPKFATGGELMIMKNVLALIRKKTYTINKHLVDLENELVEKAAELGDNDAITILAYETINDARANKEDKTYARKLISDLNEIKHPLTFKLAGDLAYNKKLNEQAEAFYLEFLKVEDTTILSSEVYKILGIINFNKPDLTKSKLYFEKSIKYGPLDNCIESHFYLGQLNQPNPKLSKYHLELAASKGLKESFANLGFLEMNYFNNYEKANEWFKLGIEIKDVTCFFGQFDCYMKAANPTEAKKVLDKIDGIYKWNIKNNKKNSIETFKKFFESRKDKIKSLQ